MGAAWLAAGLTHTSKIVLLALADNANDAGVCWPSIPNIATRCSMDERSIYRVIALLEGGGHLTTEARPGKSTIYRVHPQTPDPKSVQPLTKRQASHATTPDVKSSPPLTHSQAPQKPTPDRLSGTPDTQSVPPPVLPPHTPPSYPPPVNPQEPSGRARARARSRTVPEDFEVTQAMREWARAKCPEVNIEAETESFRDHEFRDPRSNWPAAWRQWMRRSPQFKPRMNGAAKRDYKPSPTTAELEALESAHARR
jgi:hypothetical protein